MSERNPITSKTCAVSGCDAAYHAKGLCDKHYKRLGGEAAKAKRRAAARKRYAANPEKHRARTRKQYAVNPELARERTRRWVAANPHKIRLYEHANRDRAAARQRKWKLANPERYAANARKQAAGNVERSRKWYLANKERKTERGKEWRLANPGAMAAITAKHHAAKLQATPPWADLIAIKAIYAEAAKRGLAVDHIIPLQGRTVCGLHVPWNLQLLTKSENSSKLNKLLSL